MVYDDEVTIVQNVHIRELDRFQEKVGITNILNRSVVLLTYAVNLELGGFNVFGYHLLNLTLHILVSITLYFLSLELLVFENQGTRFHWRHLPIFVSVIHTIHPLGVQTVAYLSNRSTLLVSWFLLLTFYGFTRSIHYRIRNSGFLRTAGYLILILGCLFLGFGSKVTMLASPFVLAFYYYVRFPNSSLAHRIFPWVVLVLLIGGYFGYRFWQRGHLNVLQADPSSYELSSVLYFWTQLKVIPFYYGLKLLFPFGLNFEPHIKMAQGWMEFQNIFGASVVMAACFLIWRHPSRLVHFSFLWAMISILPTSSFLPLKQMASEHRVYLAGIACYIFGVRCLLSPDSLRLQKFFTILIAITLFSMNAVNRNLDYRSEIQLWQDTLQKSPKKEIVQNNLALAYLKESHYEAAEQMLKTVLELNPFFLDAYNNLGDIYFKQGKYLKALKQFDFALKFGSKGQNTYYNAGLSRFQLGRAEEAVPFFLQAIELDPDHSPYYLALGNAFKKLKRYDEALVKYKKALEFNPIEVGAMNNRGVIFMELNNLGLAEKEFLRILSFRPEFASAHNNLATLYMVQGQYDKVIRHLDHYITLRPDDKNAIKVRRAVRLFSKSQTQ